MAEPDPEQVKKMHHYFAVECNNRAWELAEKESRTGDENEELEQAANASAYHWAKIGNAINDARADLLLAEVAAHQGNGLRSLSLAKKCSEVFAGEGSDWDKAFVHLELALAHTVAGNHEQVGDELEEASRRGELLAEQSDRDFFSESQQRIVGLIEARRSA